MAWIKALHIIFMVTWFAGLFYLPRLFVYHAQTDDKLSHDRFLLMEKKLFIIMTIGAILTIGLGIILFLNFSAIPLWFYVKMAFVAALISYHVYCYKIMRHFIHQENIKTHIFYRWFNEAPTLLLFAIVVLAVLKQQII